MLHEQAICTNIKLSDEAKKTIKKMRQWEHNVIVYKFVPGTYNIQGQPVLKKVFDELKENSLLMTGLDSDCLTSYYALNTLGRTIDVEMC